MSEHTKQLEKHYYDPYKDAPLSMNERVVFNISVLYITMVSTFVFALTMVAKPSFFSAFLGFIWAIPGLLVLTGYYSGRAKKKLRVLHTFIFLAEIMFLLYVILMFSTASVSPALQDNRMIYSVVYPLIYILYVLALEIGIFRMVKKHENAYFEEKLKDRIIR
ncbi:MAG: hypothetical protein ACI4UM_01715 [Succinivibrio sp.]